MCFSFCWTFMCTDMSRKIKLAERTQSHKHIFSSNGAGDEMWPFPIRRLLGNFGHGNRMYMSLRESHCQLLGLFARENNKKASLCGRKSVQPVHFGFQMSILEFSSSSSTESTLDTLPDTTKSNPRTRLISSEPTHGI